MIDPQDAHLSGGDLVSKNVGCFADYALAGSWSATFASAFWKSGEQLGFIANAFLDEFGGTFAASRQVDSNLIQVAYGRLAPDGFHAVAFCLRALRIAS